MDSPQCEIQQIQTQTKNLSELPEEILLTIFSYLPKRSLARIAQVAKRFKRISYDASLWKKVDFMDEKLGPGTLGFVLSRGAKRLSLNNCKFLEPFFMEQELAEFQLDHLSFTYLHGHLPENCYRALLLVLSCCRQLRTIDLSAEAALMSDDFYREVSKNRNLQVLNLWTDLKFDSVFLLARKCQRLCSWLYFGREIEMTVSEIHAVIDELTTSIETLYIFKFNISMRDEHVAKLVNKCPNITNLHLQSCSHVTSEAIRHLCSLEKLEYLNISRCREISAISLRQLQRVRSLQRLVAFNVIPSDSEVQALQRALPLVAVDAFALPMSDEEYDL